MKGVSFLAIFAEKIEPVEINGRYDPELQMLMDISSPSNACFLSQPTHFETNTGGYGDTDTGSSED